MVESDAKSFAGEYFIPRNVIKKKKKKMASRRIASFVFASDAFLVCFPFYRSRSP